MAEPERLQRRYAREDATLWRGVIGGVLLLVPGCDETVHVSTPGDVVWDLLAEPRTLDQLAEALAAEYGEPVDTVLRDVEPIVRSLHDLGAVRSV